MNSRAPGIYTNTIRSSRTQTLNTPRDSLAKFVASDTGVIPLLSNSTLTFKRKIDLFYFSFHDVSKHQHGLYNTRRTLNGSCIFVYTVFLILSLLQDSHSTNQGKLIFALLIRTHQRGCQSC